MLIVNAVDGTKETANAMASKRLNTSMQNTFRNTSESQRNVKNTGQCLYTLFCV